MRVGQRRGVVLVAGGGLRQRQRRALVGSLAAHHLQHLGLGRAALGARLLAFEHVRHFRVT